jgi:hypothetical protein
MADGIKLDADGNATSTINGELVEVHSIKVTVEGDERQAGLAALITSSGAEGSRSGTLVDSSNPLPVVQTGTPALPTGAATLAEQQSQTTQLTAAASGIGTSSSAAATAGSAGDINAKLRLMTTQLDTISTALAAVQTSVQLLDNAISGNELQVDIVSGAGSGGTALADRTGTFTPGTTSFTPVGGYVDDTSSDALAEGNPGAVRMTTARAMHVHLASPTTVAVQGGKTNNNAAPGATNVGTLPAVANASAPSHTEGNQVSLSADLAGALRVTGSNGTSVQTDDANFTPGTGKISMVGGTYRATRDTLDDTDGGAIALTERRAVLACLETPAGDSVVDDTNDALKVVNATAANLKVEPAGNVGHGTADAGNPVKVGAKAVVALSTATMESAADRTDLTSDIDAAVLMRPQFPLGDLISERVSNTDGNSTAFTNFGAVANTRSVITAITVLRTDAGTSMAYVDFRDGTAGSVLYTVPLPPNGGAVLPAGATPYFRTSQNTALAYDVSSALTTVIISITGFKSKV